MSCDTDCPTLELRLAEARLALHQLQIGGKEQSVTFGSGKSVTYTQANRRDLEAYITALRDEHNACCGNASAGKRGPIRFGF